MKKLIILISMLTAAASLSLADEGERPGAIETPKKVVKEAMLKTGASNSVTGKVESVTPADLLTRPRSKIVISDGSGNRMEFTVKALSVIYDSTGRFMTLNDIKPERQVRIDYVTKANKADERAERVKEAVSIKILNK